MWLSLLLVVHIKAVLELPPRLSFRSLVKVDSLNGTLVPSPSAKISSKVTSGSETTSSSFCFMASAFVLVVQIF
jgi:hypothetical protein